MESRSPSLELQAIVTDENGIKRIELSVNGLPLEGGRDIRVGPKPNEHKTVIRRSIPLSQANTSIRIVAYNNEDLVSEEIIEVKRIMTLPKIYAVVIGVGNYENRNIRRLNYTVEDAKGFADYLKSYLGVPEQNVIFLTDNSATLSEIKSAIGTKLRERVGPEDQVYVFFAGHGAVEEDSQNLDGDGMEKYLLPVDTNPMDLYATALPMQEIAKMFDRIPSKRIVFIADTCYSGAAGGRTITTANRRATISGKFLDRVVSGGEGRIILAASGPNEVSQEDSKLGHGVFTYYLLEGLRGKADSNQDGFVSCGEVYQYLTQEVPKATRNNQHPVLKAEAKGEIFIGQVRH